MSVSFPLFDSEVTISQSRDIYNSYRQRYEKIANFASEAFEQQYKNEIKSYDDLMSKAYKMGFSAIYTACDTAVADLVRNEIYNINVERFYDNYYVDFDVWDSTFGDLEELVARIDGKERMRDDYRVARRQGRGRLIGGGFGLSAAAKGIAMAGALNTASGAAHATFNGIGKIFSSISTANQKKKIFSDPKLLESFTDSIYWSVFNVHYALIVAFNDMAIHDPIDAYVSDKDETDAEIILNNMRRYKVSDTEKKNLIIKAIDLNPYDIGIYLYAMECFGDEKNEVENIANYFGIDLNEYKYMCVEHHYNSLLKDSKEHLLNAKSDVLTLSNRLGIKSAPTALLEDIENRLHISDQNERTFDNTVFSSKEEATKAKMMKNNIIASYNKVDRKDEDKLATLLDQYNKMLGNQKQTDDNKIYYQYITSVISHYRDEVASIIDTLDKEARTVDEYVFATRDEAELARCEKNIIDKHLDKVVEYDESTIETLIDTFSKEQFKTKLSLDAIEMLKDDLDAIKRTVEGREYNTIEEAQIERYDRLTIPSLLNGKNLSKKKTLKKLIGTLESNHKSTYAAYVKHDLESKLEAVNKKREDKLSSLVGCVCCIIILTVLYIIGDQIQ